MPRIAIVTSKPTPYRIPVFQALSQLPDVVLQVIFCTKREPNRLWDLPPIEFDHVFLRERFVTLRGRTIHQNLDVIPALKRFAPEVLVTGGFNPSHLYAFGYAIAKGVAHVPMTDGTYLSEQSLTRLHRAIRRIVYAKSRAFVSASEGGQRLYESYGIPVERCFRSCLCVDNNAFEPLLALEDRSFDFLFCGRMEAAKNPLFALQVAVETAHKLQRKVRLLYVGAGSEEGDIRSAASRVPDVVDAYFHGFAQQGQLPALYRSARVALFPTLLDAWGVVANEACAAGLPVIVSPHAGAAGELVRDGENGFVCPLVLNQWAERATLLLTQPQRWQQYSRQGLSLVREYSCDSAARGLLAACCVALSGNSGNIP